MIEPGPSKINPEDLEHHADLPAAKEAAAGKQSMLNKFIGKNKFIFSEANLDGEEKTQGVTIDSSRAGNQQLIFDRETINEAEMAALTEFAKLYAEGGKDALSGTQFEWFFAEEDEIFLDDLVKILIARQQELHDGQSQSSLRNVGFSEKLVTAMESFREMAKRKKLKEGINKQVEKVPIIGFQAKLKGAGPNDPPVQLRFNPQDITDPTNEVDVLFVNNEDSEKELIFSCKDPDKYEVIRPVLETTANENPKSYSVIDSSFKRVKDIDPDTGTDYTRFEFDIAKKPGQLEPLFSKIKVLMKPVNLDQELDAYLEKKLQEETAEMLEEARKAQQYAAQRPSVPSSSQYRWQQQPQTYSRSG